MNRYDLRGLRALPALVAALMLVMSAGVGHANLPALERFEYREDFESRRQRAWASYPTWQDAAYDQNFRVNEMVPGDPNISIVQLVTPYTAVDNYAGAQKLFDLYLLPGDEVRLRYYIKSHLPAEWFKVRLAAGDAGKVDYTIAEPVLNGWQTVTVRFEDFVAENPALAGQSFIKLNSLAVLTKIAEADPKMPIYLGLDDVEVRAHRETAFIFEEPVVHELTEFRPRVPARHYRPGESFRLAGRWPLAADRVELRVASFAEREQVVYQGQLEREGARWQLDPLTLDWPAGFYYATLTAREGDRVLATSDFTLHIAPDLSGRRPRLLFDEASLRRIKGKIAAGETGTLVEDLKALAAEQRKLVTVDSLVYDLDQFPEENWLPTWSVYGERIFRTESPLFLNALAWTLGGDREAGRYVCEVLLKQASWPDWTHPWQTRRGRFSEHRTGAWAHTVAIAYDLVRELLSEEEARQIRSAFRSHLIEGVHKMYVEDNDVTCNTSNWISHTAGGSLMLQMAIFDDGEEVETLEPMLTGALLKLHTFINATIDPEGAYGEGLAYNSYTFRTLSRSLPALRHTFNIDLSKPLEPIYKEYIWAGPVLDREYFYYGDSRGRLNVFEHWAFLLTRSRDPLLSWFYQLTREKDAAGKMNEGQIRLALTELLYPVADVPQQDPFELNPVKAFRGVGTTVFKSGWKADDFIFVMRTGPFFNHQHLDQGSIWLADRGRKFLTKRSGSDYYDDQYYQSHYIQPVGHSTVLIDRNEQSQRVGDHEGMAEGFDDYSYIAQFVDGEHGSFVSGDLGRLYWGKVDKLRRNVLYLKPRGLLMLDVAEPAEADVEVTALYHAARLADIEVGAASSTIADSGAQLHFAHLSPAQVEVEKVGTPHYLRNLQNRQPLEREGMLTVTARSEGGPVVLANLLTTTLEGEAPAIQTRRGEGFVEGEIDGSAFAFSTKPGQVYRVGQLETDALAVSWNGERVLAGLATELARGGRTLVRSSEPVSFEWSPAGLGYDLEQPARVSVGVEGRPATVKLGGEAINFEYREGVIEVELPAGEGVLEINAR